MNLVKNLAPHLPYLRRYARALTGAQESGDAYIRASLEALVASPDKIDADGDPEDTEPLRVKREVYSPTASEVEDHRKTHYPYRSWCRECVEGHALGEHRHPAQVHWIAVLGMDFFYMTISGVQRREELEFARDEDGENKLKAACSRGEIVKCVMLLTERFGSYDASRIIWKIIIHQV